MSKAVLDTATILKHATPLTRQKGQESQPFGHLVRMPIALAESACKESVENLNQGFTHCFIVTFKNAKARDHYLPHPVHEEFKKLAIPRIEKVMVVDFYAKK